MKWYNLLMTALLAITVSGAVALADSSGVTASFTSDVTSGSAPLTVQFTDTSLGGPIAWQWDFGDGSPIATEQNPSHTFTAPGNYIVTLTVTDGTNSASATGNFVVGDDALATPAPAAASSLIASFLPDVTDGAAPLAVQFTDTSAGSPTAWQWNFGDGSANVTLQNPAYTFPTPGAYTVMLTVSDGVQSSTATSQINVEAGATAVPLTDTATPAPTAEAPAASATATPSPALSAGLTALTMIAAAGLVLFLGKAGKK